MANIYDHSTLYKRPDKFQIKNYDFKVLTNLNKVAQSNCTKQFFLLKAAFLKTL